MLFAAGVAEEDPGGGGDPDPGEGDTLTAPSGLGVYDYQAGTKFGLQWTNGATTASTEVYRDDVLFATRSPGLNTFDVGLKSGDGSHTWKARHVSGAATSPFSSSISTANGVAN